MTQDEALNIFSTGCTSRNSPTGIVLFFLGPARRRRSYGHEQGCQDEQRQDSLAEKPTIAAVARTTG